MPLFMDRHDLPGVTAEEVAQAHLTDLQVESKYAVQFLAYWFDADLGQVFCLARASRPEDVAAVHRDGHGLVPNEIIAVSEDDVFRFLGRVTDPIEHTEGVRAFRTILFTDLKGSTSLLQEVGELAYLRLLDEHDLIIRRSLVTWRGREVKHTGDGVMASFEDVAYALRCSLAIQGGFEARMSEATLELVVRIGIAAGEPVDHNDDLFGSTVNLASRICDASDPGHILTSDLVHDMGTEKGFSFGQGHDVELKGFGPVRVFELVRAVPEPAGSHDGGSGMATNS
jgi:class 3 adenylate cyclase